MLTTIRGDTVFVHTGGHPFDPSRPVLVLVHGAGMDHTVWSGQSRFLAQRGVSVLAVDLPGHGRSGGAPLERIDAMAQWVIDLLGALGAGRAVVAGHSMGALVALALAAAHPGRVAALALLGVAERMPVHPDLLALAARGDPRAADLVATWSVGPRGTLAGSPTPGIALLPLTRRLLQRARPGVLGTDLAACHAYADGAAAAARVACPARLLLGELDRMTPARAGCALADAIPGARADVLPGVGHMAMSEAPDAVAQGIATLIATPDIFR